MLKDDFINLLNSNSHIVTIQPLIHQVNCMNENNLNVLCEYAGRFFRQDNVYNWVEEAKIVTLIAESLNIGRSTSFISGLVDVKNFDDAYYMCEIQKVLDRYGFSMEDIFAVNVPNRNELPIQGWKFHTPSNSLRDYYHLCSALVPELIQNNVMFKMVRPQDFMRQLRSNQAGKAITVYEPFIDKLSPQTKQMLLNWNPYVVKPKGDMLIQGIVYGRYGRFQKSNSIENCITCPDGHIEYDQRGIVSTPSFILSQKPNEVLNFYSNAEEKFKKTGDKKTYLQEYYTMASCDGKSHAYIIFEVDKCDIHKYQQALMSFDSYSLSFVVDNSKMDGNSYIFVHSSSVPYISQIVDRAISYGATSAKRPSWDVKFNRYEINPEQIQLGIAVAQSISEIYGPELISAVQTENGNLVIRCDSSIDGCFKDWCRENSLGIRDEPQKGKIRTFVDSLMGKNEINIPLQNNPQFVSPNLEDDFGR